MQEFPEKFIETLETYIARAQAWDDTNAELVLRLLTQKGEVPIDEERIARRKQEQIEIATHILSLKDHLSNKETNQL